MARVSPTRFRWWVKRAWIRASKFPVCRWPGRASFTGRARTFSKLSRYRPRALGRLGHMVMLGVMSKRTWSAVNKIPAASSHRHSCPGVWPGVAMTWRV